MFEVVRPKELGSLHANPNIQARAREQEHRRERRQRRKVNKAKVSRCFRHQKSASTRSVSGAAQLTARLSKLLRNVVCSLAAKGSPSGCASGIAKGMAVWQVHRFLGANLSAVGAKNGIITCESRAHGQQVLLVGSSVPSVLLSPLQYLTEKQRIDFELMRPRSSLPTETWKWACQTGLGLTRMLVSSYTTAEQTRPRSMIVKRPKVLQ